MFEFCGKWIWFTETRIIAEWSKKTAKIAQDKIDSQEDIAQLRANVNLEKQNGKPNN